MPEHETENLKIDKYQSPRQLLGVLESCDVFVTSMLHLGLTGLTKGTPFISYRGPGKAKSFLRSIGGDWAIVDDNIIHYGFTDNPYAFMRIADIYMSASLAEGFSIAVLEAMDNGLTLFLSDIPSHLEVFEENSDAGPYLGETFTSGDEKSFLASWDRLRGNYARIDKQRIISFKESEMSVNGMIMGYKELYQKKK